MQTHDTGEHGPQPAASKDSTAPGSRPTYRPLPAEVYEALGPYNYGLVDPRPGVRDPLFYIGRGRRQRVLAHVWTAQMLQDDLTAAYAFPGVMDAEVVREEVEAAEGDVELDKLERIRAIHDAGFRVRHVLLGWLGADVEEQLDIESVSAHTESIAINVRILAATADPYASLADAGLTNLVRGAHSQMVDLDDLVLALAAPAIGQLDDDFAVVVINKKFDPRMSDAELMDALSGIWMAGATARANPNLKILAVAGNIVRAAVRAIDWEEVEPRFWRFTPVPDAALTHLVKTRVDPRAFGYDRWPDNGWLPQLTRRLAP
ncbi:hypothetical protein [Modestobacter altitudinis]|uniref:hypothetical protein n=1 Tax=Modestobacter altitudinis TaxID=2213158 RepID=UPI00110CD895|nr:hypothetical protein [Modestobacter altitudinis]